MSAAIRTQANFVTSDSPLIVRVADDFSRFPGPRFKSDGPFSGQEFRETLLEPKFLEARERQAELMIDLDGAVGYPTSFLEESFGGLARLYGAEVVLKHLRFHSTDEPGLEREITSYISDIASK